MTTKSLDDPEYIQGLLAKVPLFATVKKSAWQGNFEKTFAELLKMRRLQFRIVEPGEVVVRQGNLDTEFFVVLEGLATAYRTENDGTTVMVGSFGAADWFGEMAALSHQPRNATIKADARTILIEIDIGLFQKLYDDKASSFRKMIDERYRDRALSVHLTSAPIFKGLPKELMKTIAKGAELKTYDADVLIAEQGKTADAVYLIRCGIVKKATIQANGDELVQEYLCDNSSFGERAVSGDNSPWPANYMTMSRTDVVRLPRELFQAVFAADDKTRMSFVARAAALGAGDSGALASLSADEKMELMVGQEAIKGGEALVIDLKKCTRCNACVESCVSVHKDGVPRLSKSGIRMGGDVALASACYNCKTPDCMLGCKFGAIRRDVNGQVHIVYDNCTGCSICESKCPYGVIRMADMLTEDADEYSESILTSIPLIGHLFAKKPAPPPMVDAAPGAKKEREMKAIKCDLCGGLPFEACVYNCPCTAIQRVSPERLVGSLDVTRR